MYVWLEETGAWCSVRCFFFLLLYDNELMLNEWKVFDMLGLH